MPRHAWRAAVALVALLALSVHLAAAADLGGRRVRFGIQTPNHTSWDDLLATWREADSLGYDTAYLYDHFMPIFADADGPNLEGWTALAALAASAGTRPWGRRSRNYDLRHRGSYG